MTSAIKSPSLLAPRRGFTLMELLLVIGILVILAGILFPAITAAHRKAVRARTQADLQTIAVALEAYKADWGGYPTVDAQNSGAAALCRALIGPYDEAQFFTFVASRTPQYAAENTLRNTVLPPMYAGGNVYQAGDVVTTGRATPFDAVNSGTQTDFWVCARNDTTGQMPSTTDKFWWARFFPYDGHDGAGSKGRLTAVTEDSSGKPVGPHRAAGKVYGPYLEADRFKTNGMAILDRNDCPILYFPVNRAFKPLDIKGTQLLAAKLPAGTKQIPRLANRLTYPRNLAIEDPAMVNVNDNIGPFLNETVSPQEAPDIMLARVLIMLGDYNVDRLIDTAAAPGVNIEIPELPAPSVPYLLWTAGSDRRFGPAGQADPAISTSKGDFYTTADKQRENQVAAERCDDVTNFR